MAPPDSRRQFRRSCRRRRGADRPGLGGGRGPASAAL